MIPGMSVPEELLLIPLDWVVISFIFPLVRLQVNAKDLCMWRKELL